MFVLAGGKPAGYFKLERYGHKRATFMVLLQMLSGFKPKCNFCTGNPLFLISFCSLNLSVKTDKPTD